MTTSTMTIDAVITWVDGNDPILNAKRQQYGTTQEFSQNYIAGSTRYANIGEIFWCVASINRFAPWIRKIFIVTDGQDPHLEPFLQKHFPEGYIPMEIIDHTTIFRGYEEYLPTFNSNSIETMLWRIPNLSEHFIYFNDDLLLLSPVTPADFFTEDGIISKVTWNNIWWTKVRYYFNPAKHAFKWMMVQTAKIMGEKWRYMRLCHTPRGLLRSYFEEFFTEHEDLMRQNIQYRFRSKEHFHIMELEYLGLYHRGQNKIEPIGNELFYVEPKKKAHYTINKVKTIVEGSYKYGCLNSLDLASKEEQQIIATIIEQYLGLTSK